MGAISQAEVSVDALGWLVWLCWIFFPSLKCTHKHTHFLRPK